MFAALPENGQAHIAAACQFSIFRLAPVVVGIKKKRGNSPMHGKSYERDRQPESRRLTEKQIAESENFSGGLHFLVK